MGTNTQIPNPPLPATLQHDHLQTLGDWWHTHNRRAGPFRDNRNAQLRHRNPHCLEHHQNDTCEGSLLVRCCYPNSRQGEAFRSIPIHTRTNRWDDQDGMLEEDSFLELAKACVRVCHVLKAVTEREGEGSLSGPSTRRIEDLGRCDDPAQRLQPPDSKE